MAVATTTDLDRGYADGCMVKDWVDEIPGFTILAFAEWDPEGYGWWVAYDATGTEVATGCDATNIEDMPHEVELALEAAGLA